MLNWLKELNPPSIKTTFYFPSVDKEGGEIPHEDWLHAKRWLANNILEAFKGYTGDYKTGVGQSKVIGQIQEDVEIFEVIWETKDQFQKGLAFWKKAGEYLAKRLNQTCILITHEPVLEIRAKSEA